MTLYEKILYVFGLIRSSIESLRESVRLLGKIRHEIAPPFDPDELYLPGRFVFYGDSLFKCVVRHDGPWDEDDFEVTTVDDAITELRNDAGQRLMRTEAAGSFSEYNTYYKGRLVVKDGELYRCLVRHSGTWEPAKFTRSTVDLALTFLADTAQNNIAGNFNPDSSYGIGRLVFYNNELYRCTTAHSGEWNSSHFSRATVDDVAYVLKSEIGARALRNELAGAFNPLITYNVGRVVIYENALYRCTRVHTGEWSDSDFTMTTIDEAIAAGGGGGGGGGTGSAWTFRTVGLDRALILNGCNIINMIDDGNITFTLPSPDQSECRQFAIMMMNAGDWNKYNNHYIDDNYSGQHVAVVDKGSMTTLSQFIAHAVGEKPGYDVFLKLIEFNRGQFSVSDFQYIPT